MLAIAGLGSIADLVRPLLSPTALAQVEEYDHGFAEHSLLTLLHVVSGALFIVLAPFQFSASIRARALQFHRWSGRILIGAGLMSGITGLLLSVPFRFTGPSASLAVIVFGPIFLVSLLLAYNAIRQGNTTRHREWMIRAFAVAIGVATVRVVGLILFLTAVTPFVLLGISFWAGWTINASIAEWWIRHSRPVN